MFSIKRLTGEVSITWVGISVDDGVFGPKKMIENVITRDDFKSIILLPIGMLQYFYDTELKKVQCHRKSL